MRRGLFLIVAGLAMFALMLASFAYGWWTIRFQVQAAVLLVLASGGFITWGLTLIVLPAFTAREEAKPSPDRAQGPLVVAGPPIDGSAIDYTSLRLLPQLKPAHVLLDLIAVREREGRLVSTVRYDGVGPGASSAEHADLKRRAMETRLLHESDPNYRLAAERLARAGVECRFGGTGDPAEGESAALLLVGSEASLPLLEQMAADDAGFASANERAQAADRFHIFIARNYGRNWQENRAIYPDVGGSPYSPKSSWPRST